MAILEKRILWTGCIASLTHWIVASMSFLVFCTIKAELEGRENKVQRNRKMYNEIIWELLQWFSC